MQLAVKTFFESASQHAATEQQRIDEPHPNDVTTLRFYSFYLAFTGRPVEALPMAGQACRLDPVSPNARMNLGAVLYLARRFDEAVRQFEETLELDANFSFAQAMLGQAYLSKGCPIAPLQPCRRRARSVVRVPTSSHNRDKSWRARDTA
jgi:predicted Zn-dependent protease